ncbi:MAG: hypothetical protein R3F55_00205 [Alphaproteobacteria bacterium]
MGQLASVTAAKEASDLETHVILCQQRYEALERRLVTVERTLSQLLWTVAGGFGSVLIVMLGALLSQG